MGKEAIWEEGKCLKKRGDDLQKNGRTRTSIDQDCRKDFQSLCNVLIQPLKVLYRHRTDNMNKTRLGQQRMVIQGYLRII